MQSIGHEEDVSPELVSAWGDGDGGRVGTGVGTGEGSGDWPDSMSSQLYSTG